MWQTLLSIVELCFCFPHMWCLSVRDNVEIETKVSVFCLCYSLDVKCASEELILLFEDFREEMEMGVLESA